MTAVDQVSYCYYTRHPGEDVRERGEIDLDSALLLISHFHWTPSQLAIDNQPRPRKPGRRFRLSLRPWVAAESDEAAQHGRLIGFLAPGGPELAITGLDEHFRLELAVPRRRPLVFGLKMTTWHELVACTGKLEDVVCLVKLFFNGRVSVLEDLLRAAESPEQAQTEARPRATLDRA